MHCIQELFRSFVVTEKPGDSHFSHAQTLQAMKPKHLKKSHHKLHVVHYMLIVETGETVTSRRVYTPCDVTRSYFGTNPWKMKRSFWDYFGPGKNIFSPGNATKIGKL